MGAIRLFLAFAVLQSHVRTFILVPNQIYVNNTLGLVINGGYAVMFFFVISGFLMSFVLEGKYDRTGGTGDFYRARAARIYPLWWVV
jgi:peptidoglycan/LPS O-acetylase OafA/YrhL